METVFKALNSNAILTPLFAREDIIAFSRRETLIPYPLVVIYKTKCSLNRNWETAKYVLYSFVISNF